MQTQVQMLLFSDRGHISCILLLVHKLRFWYPVTKQNFDLSKKITPDGALLQYNIVLGIFKDFSYIKHVLHYCLTDSGMISAIVGMTCTELTESIWWVQ